MAFNQPTYQTHVGAQHHGDFFSFGNQPNQPPQAQPNPFATNMVTSQPGSKPNPFGTTVPQQPNPFATNVPVNNNQFGTQPTQPNPFATNVLTSQPGSQPGVKPNPFATTVQQQPPNTYNSLHSSETKEYLQNKIAELEATYKHLLDVFQKAQDENNLLRQQLGNKDGGLSAAHQELEAKLKLQQEQFNVANAKIRAHLDSTRENYEKEKRKLISDQVAFAKNSVNQYLFRYDDANFPGNVQANGEDILKGVNNVKDSYDKLLKAIEEGGDVVGASKRLADNMQKLLEDSKGLANRVDDPELKVQLMEGTRNLTRLAGKLLSDGQEMVGRRPNQQEILEMRSRQNNFHHTGDNIKNAISSSGKKGMETLDSLAEKELKNASRVIAEAAESLKRQAALQKAAEEERIRQQLALGFDINEIRRQGSNVGEIALSVTGAAQMLMEAAQAAQQERIQRGVDKKGDSSYHVDPMWAEGLISAAKAVASSMKVLVGAANNALAGKVDEGALVACCKAVAAHTGKLQISSKVKADRDSVAQVRVDKAAKLVKDTTSELLVETKRVADFEEVDIGLKIKDTEVGNIRAEMELEGIVSRFRSDVDTANNKLYEIRKLLYADSNKDHQPDLKKAQSNAKPLSSVIHKSSVDTTSIVSPFGKSASTTPVPVSPSFADFKDSDYDESDVLPKYMQNKLVIKDDPSKFEKALSTKTPMVLAARPLHLQHDLNSNNNQSASNIQFNNTNSQANVAFSQPTQQPFQPTQQPSQPTQQPPNNNFFTQQNDNPFLAPQQQPQQQQQFVPQFDNSNPFLSPPTTTPQQSSNPFF